MKTLLAFTFVCCAFVVGYVLDSGSLLDDLQTRQDIAREIESRENAQLAQARFDRAAQVVCGENAGWYMVEPGVIDCATHRGHRTLRGVVLAQGR